MFVIITILILSLFFIYLKVIRPYSTWSKLLLRKGIKQSFPPYLLGDSAGPILGRHTFFEMLKRLYNSFPEERYFGMYQMTLPTLMIRDPELIKTLTVKDFDHFVNRRPLIPDGIEPVWTRNLAFMQDNEWKQTRITLTPSFTSAKLKGIFHLTSECCDVYVKYFQRHTDTKHVELKDLTMRYTNDVIATVAYGVNCDSINNKNNEFFTMARSISEVSKWRLLAFSAYTLAPALSKALKIPFLPRNTTQFFTKLVKDTIRIRREQGRFRPDMMQLYIENRKGHAAKNDGDKLEFSDEDIAAQAFVFFIAGSETVTTTLYFMGHSLATHPDIQKKLQQEIDQALEECEGKLTYETLLKMKYLDMVISETLRKWPPAPSLDRLCTKAYTLPPSNDKGKPMKISPGQPIIFPVIAYHHDAEYFPNPEIFDPERFNDENKNTINPYVYMPFGLGPRNCIASRLALLKIKIFYFYFLLHFDFVQTEKTETSLMLSRRSVNMGSEHDVWIGIRQRIK